MILLSPCSPEQTSSTSTSPTFGPSIPSDTQHTHQPISMLLSHLPRSLLLLTLALADLLPPTTASAHLRPGQPTELNSPLRRQDDNNDNDPYEAKLPDDLPQRMGMIYPDPSESLYPGQLLRSSGDDPGAGRARWRAHTSFGPSSFSSSSHAHRIEQVVSLHLVS